MKKRIKRKGQSGQSIIELLIAILVLSMVLVSVTLMATKSIQLSQTASSREKAISLARTEIEEIRKNRYVDCMWSEFKDLGSTCWINEEDKYNLVDGKYKKNLSDNYTATITLEEIENLDGKEIIPFTLKIEWNDVKGQHEVIQNISFSE